MNGKYYSNGQVSTSSFHQLSKHITQQLSVFPFPTCGVVGLGGGTIGVWCLRCLGIIQCSEGVGGNVAVDAVEGWVAMSAAVFEVAWSGCW